MARTARRVLWAVVIGMSGVGLTGCRSAGEPVPPHGPAIQQASYTEDNAFSAQKITPCKH